MPVIDWPKLFTNHHSYDDIHKHVPGLPRDDPKTKDVDEGIETCCIQMSHALNLSGLLITGAAAGIGSRSNNMNYIWSVPDMRVFLDTTYGPSENYTGKARIDMILRIVDRRGIIAFGNRHIDLWRVANIHRPWLYDLGALWEAKSTRARGIFFWEVPYSEVLGF